MVDTHATELRGTVKVNNGTPLGKLGLILLGLSFSIWAILMSIELAANFYPFSQDSPFFLLLVFASMGSTSLGIILVNTDLRKMLIRGRLLIRISTLVFTIINAVGLFLVYFVEHGGHGGLNLGGPEPMVRYIYILAEAAIYIAYVFVYNSFLFPFLDLAKRWIAFIADSLAGIYIAVLLLYVYYSNQPFLDYQVKIPQTTIVQGVQLANPLFGLPGIALNESYNYLQNK